MGGNPLRGKSRSSPLCGLLKRDGVTEAFELGDEAFGGAGGVAAAVVVAAEVGVELAGGEHVPGGDEHRVLDRADRFAVADPATLAFVERAQVAVLGADRGHRGVLERSVEPARALASASGTLFAGGAIIAGALPGPGRQVPCA